MNSFNPLTAGAVHIRFYIIKKVLLTVYMSTLTYWSFYFFIFFFVRFFYAAQIGYTIGCHYPTILNSLGHCICVHHRKISAAAGFEPGTPRL